MNLRPTKSKFRVSKVDISQKGFGSFVDENALLLNSAQSIKDYDDLTYLGRQAIAKSPFAKSLSTYRTPFNDYLKGKKAVHYTDNNFVRWRSYGEPDMRHIFMEIVTDQTYLGLGGLPFDIKTSFDGLLPGTIIAPLLNKRKQMRVLYNGSKMGGGTIYTVELIADDEDAYILASDIAEGTFFIDMGSAYGEGSKDLANLQFGKDVAYSEYEVPMITGRWQYKVTNLAHERFGNLKIGQVEDGEGGIQQWIKDKTKITGWLEMEAFAQINWMQELWDTYGSASETLIDRSSTKELTTSPGMFEFLEQGNVFRYSVASDTLEAFTNKLEIVWFDRVAKEEQSVVFFTGKGGLLWIDEKIREKYGDEAVLGTFDFVLGESESFHNNPKVKGYSYKIYQFTQYNLPGWGIVNFAHWDMLDNTKINVVKAPNGIYPATSYEFFAFNIKLGDLNVRKLIRNNSESAAYICGHWSPMGGIKPGSPFVATHTGLYYQWGMTKGWGLQISDIECTMWIKPNWVY